MIHIDFNSGTLLLWEEGGGGPEKAPPAGIGGLCTYDARVRRWRAHASAYAEIITALYHAKVPYDDRARQYEEVNLTLGGGRLPRDYQREALAAWRVSQRRGVVVLPTGTGKSFLAQLAMAACNRSTLVVAPTIDLISQWAVQLRAAFGCPVGLLGGGEHDIQPITVATYDSAQQQMEYLGNRFALLVVDECHHLPGAMYSQIARLCIAPFRLGLTATPERQDGLDSAYAELLGPICYRREITDLSPEGVLAPYETIPIDTELDPDEQELYNRNRARYLDFLHRNRISLASPKGWGAFLRMCSQQADGRAAMEAYLTQRRISRGSRSKLRRVWELIVAHRSDRVIVFTADNSSAYQLGAAFGLPVITHHTKAGERAELLERFREGAYPVLVTSKVLNEGVDVPAANVGIVVSGSGSVREHVQRLGRILRPSPGKTAVLYELVSMGTAEVYVSERRRQHPAYDGTPPPEGDWNDDVVELWEDDPSC